jgi:hypothetical protein
MLQIAVTINAARSVREHTRLARLACNCPASLPDGFRNQAGALAGRALCNENDRFVLRLLPSALGQPPAVPGADAGHYTRDGSSVRHRRC